MMRLGVDLAKAEFDATLLNEQNEKHYVRFANNASGFVQLAKWLKQHGVCELHVCMEATNIYWEALALFLHEQGYVVSVVNPARIKGFALSQLRRNKTDKQDSDVIVEFCRALNPDRWTPPTTEQRKLRSLVRHREALQKTLTQQQNRLADCQDADVRQSLQTVSDTLQREIERTEGQIEQVIAHHPALQEQQQFLLSKKGFGPVATHTIMAEMYDLADYKDAHAAAADAGVNPAHYESGATIRRPPKLSKVGKAAVRGALYWPAITAIRFNPVVRALAERLQQQNKPKKVIIAAAMRKLIHIAYGVLKNKTPFDPNWGAKPALAT